MAQLFYPFGHVDPTVQLNGNWQSCRDESGNYGERIFDYCTLGKCHYAFHMGPYDEFALYKSSDSPETEDHSHAGPTNLLSNYKVSDMPTWRGKRNWNVPASKVGLKKGTLWVSVVQAGGSRDECQSYVVKIELKP